MSTSLTKSLIIVCLTALFLTYSAFGSRFSAINEVERQARNATQVREELLTTGFTCKLFMEQHNKVYDESANVEYMEKGELFRIIFDFLQTTEYNQPNTPTILTEVKKREYSVYKNQYMQMNWFIAQGLIVDPKDVEERFVMHSVLPTQFWLNYRNRKLSDYWHPNSSFFNEKDLSLNLVTDFGHLVLFFDPQWNYLVRRVQFFIENGILMRELNVLQADEIQANTQVFFPKKFSLELFGPGVDGKSHPVNKTNWEVMEINLNRSLKEEDFEVRFPKGAKVADNITGKAYQVGNSTGEIDLTAIRNIGKDEGSDFWFGRRTILIGIAVLMLIVTFSIYLFLRSKRNTY